MAAKNHRQAFDVVVALTHRGVAGIFQGFDEIAQAARNAAGNIGLNRRGFGFGGG